MNRPRLLVGAAGALTVVAVLVAGVTLDGALAGVVDALGTDYALVAVVGGAAVAVALLAVGRSTGVDESTVPDPEDTATMPTPGDEFDRRVGRWNLSLPVVNAGERRAIRRRLRDAAAGAVRYDERCDADRARTRVAEGTWTDDPVVADFLREEPRQTNAWVAAVSSGQPPFGYAARRTAAEIARRSDVESEGDRR